MPPGRRDFPTHARWHPSSPRGLEGRGDPGVAANALDEPGEHARELRWVNLVGACTFGDMSKLARLSLDPGLDVSEAGLERGCRLSTPSPNQLQFEIDGGELLENTVMKLTCEPCPFVRRRPPPDSRHVARGRQGIHALLYQQPEPRPVSRAVVHGVQEKHATNEVFAGGEMEYRKAPHGCASRVASVRTRARKKGSEHGARAHAISARYRHRAKRL